VLYRTARFGVQIYASHPEEKSMMVAAFYLGLAAVVVGVYWLIGRDIDRAVPAAGAVPAAETAAGAGQHG
jgi:hypothetical protein